MTGVKHEPKRVVMVTKGGSQYSLRLLEGALKYVELHPRIQFREMNYEHGKPPHWLDRPLDCDGLLVWVSQSEQWAKQLLSTGVPVVNTCGSWPPPLMAAVVGFSEQAVQQTAMDYLAGLGRSTVAILSHNQEKEPSIQRRRDDFMKLATNRGLQPFAFDGGPQRSIYHTPPRLTTHGKQRLTAFLRRLPLPAAVWAIDDFMGYLVVEAAHEIGLNIPRDLAVLGLGDYTVARYCNPPVSSIPQPGDMVGFEAMRVLDDIMSGNPPEDTRIVIAHPPVVARESTHVVSPQKELIQHVHDFMVEHACQGITVENVLQIANISLPTLHKRFTAAYGCTPGTEIRRIKIERAQFYLRTTSMTITRVGQLCGFDQQAKFANFFKRETGMTPSAYRTTQKLDPKANSAPVEQGQVLGDVRGAWQEAKLQNIQ